MSEEIRRLTVRESFLAWIDQIAEWTTKADFTFAWNCNEFDARKKFEKWMRKTLPSTTYLYSIERDPNQHKVASTSEGLNQACHIHAVFDTNWHFLKRGNVTRKQIHENWKARYGRNRIEPCKSKSDTLGYCMKKVFGYSEAREEPSRVCRRTTVDWNLVFGLGKAGWQAKKRAKVLEMPEYNFELCV